MPGLSRSERILAIVDDGLRDNVSALDRNLLVNNQSCWRCERYRARNHWTLCEECRSYLACENDSDPCKTPSAKFGPTTGYYGWAYAAHMQRLAATQSS